MEPDFAGSLSKEVAKPLNRVSRYALRSAAKVGAVDTLALFVCLRSIYVYKYNLVSRFE